MEKLLPRAKLLQVVGGDADFPTGNYTEANSRMKEIVAHIEKEEGWVHSVLFIGKLETKPGYSRIRIMGYCYKPKTLQEIAKEARTWSL